MRRTRLLAVVALVVVSGCTLPGTPGELDPDRELGEVAGYASDDRFEFDGETTLTEEELEMAMYRSMARIEVIRGEQFETAVEIDVISREEYREQRSGSANASTVTNELWRGAFVVDGETDANHALDALYGDSVQGYYVSDRVVIVTDDPESIQVDRQVLVHELVHALQDQQFGIDRSGETIDEQRAELGIIEGEANYIPQLYDQRCGNEWQCLGDPEPSPSEPESVNVGLFLSIYAPYAEGPTFVSHLHETGGWERVDRAHEQRPVSTSQLIHPERYPDSQPTDVNLTDRSSSDWEPITDDGEVETETVGEATLFATLWANGVIDRSLEPETGPTAWYSYAAPETAGWAGDEFRVYTDDQNRTGYVWGLDWESEADADAFADAYRELLTANDAEQVEDGVYRIADDDPFSGAYRVTADGDRVTIVGAPTVAELDEIHAESGESPAGSPSTTVGPSPVPVTP